MPERDTIIRSLHDLGLGAWFGGALAGAVGFNGAAADVPDPTQRLRVASAGWGAMGPGGYSGVLGRKVAAHDQAPARSGTTPSQATPRQVADAQRALTIMQWVVPALTGALTVLNALYGEQQRPGRMAAGILARPGRATRTAMETALHG